jgi:hypothetical protein
MKRITQYLKAAEWFVRGKPVPPPHLIKQNMILTNARRYNPRIMVETGTLHGDMVEAMKHHFREIYSIEISHDLAQRAEQRFAGNSNIHIIEGDSAIALKKLMPNLHEPALFWLDGHYSGGDTGKGEKETPIMEELASIYASEYSHIVLIDDARCFGTKKGYPTLDELESFVRELRPGAELQKRNDCIQISPGIH